MDSDELIIKLLERARQLGFPPVADPRTVEPPKNGPAQRRGRRSPASRKDVVCGYRVGVVMDAGTVGPQLPELREDTVLIGPDLMGLSMEVVAGWCATQLNGTRGCMKNAMAAARKLRKISILAAVERCQP